MYVCMYVCSDTSIHVFIMQIVHVFITQARAHVWRAIRTRTAQDGSCQPVKPSNSERSEVSTRTRTKKYGFIHIPRVSYKCRSCSPHRVALHRQLSDYQRWIPVFKRTQSGYKPAYSPDFTYLAQKFAAALNRRPSSRSPLAASLFSSNTSNMDFYSLKT